MKNVKLFSSLFVLFSIFSCTQDDITESTSNSANTPKDYNQQIISFKEFLKAENNNYEVAKLEKYYSFEEVQNYENETSLERKQFKNDSNHEWSIDTTKVSKIATKDLTIYTFAVIEYEPIEGFRNVIVKKQNGITTNHIIHYPEGVDFENHTPRKAIFKDLDSKIQTRSEKGEVCYSVVIDLVYDCASGACKYGWHLEEKPCGAVSGSTSGGSSGSGSGSGPGGSSGNPGGNSNPGDGLGSGGGNYGGSGYGDGNNLPVYPMRGQYTEQAERLSVILQITSIRDKKWLSDNIRISNIMLEILAVDNTYQTKKQSIWLINYFIKNTRAKRHFEQNPKDLEILYYKDVDYTNTEELNFMSSSINVMVDFLINNKNNSLNNLNDSWINLENLKQKVKDAISKGIYTTAKYARNYLYLPLTKVTNNHPSSIYWSNRLIIDKIRLEAVTPMVNFNENTMGWGDLFNIWLFELTPNKYQNNIINFTNSSNVINGNNIYNPSTNAVKNLPKGNNTPGGNLLNIEYKLSNGIVKLGDTTDGYFKYDVNAFYSTLSQGNIGIQMLGSYPITAKVLSKSGRTAVVEFTITNDLGWDSGTRFIKGENGAPNRGVIDNKDVGKGLHLGGTIKNNFTWTETIKF